MTRKSGFKGSLAKFGALMVSFLAGSAGLAQKAVVPPKQSQLSGLSKDCDRGKATACLQVAAFYETTKIQSAEGAT